MTEHRSFGNEVVEGGIVHHCSCGWTSRKCFSNGVASLVGEEHREEYGGGAETTAGVRSTPATEKVATLSIITNAEIAEWCDWNEKRERERTFARDDLAPGNPRARKNQALVLEIVRRLRAMMAAG